MSENNEPTKADQIEQLDESTESVQFSVVIDDTADDADLDTGPAHNRVADAASRAVGILGQQRCVASVHVG